MRNREAGIDLLRCLALLLVTLFHFFLYNGYYYQNQVGAAMLFANGARSLSCACIGIFVMITGYLRSEETPSRRYFRSIGVVLVGYIIAAAISIPIRHFLLGNVQPLDVWVKRFFGFGGVYYGWYVEMYIGLMLLSPLVNLAIAHVTEKKTLLWLSAAMLVLTALPNATRLTLFPDWWRGIYPLTYYVLGAVVRRLKPTIKPWLGLSAACIVSLAMGAATLLSTDGVLSDALTWEFGDIWCVMIALCIFLSLYKITIRGKRISSILSWLAGGCYGGYLLSNLLDAWMYKLIPSWRVPEKYPLLFICITVPIWLTSIISGKVLDKLSRVTVSAVQKCSARVIKMIKPMQN